MSRQILPHLPPTQQPNLTVLPRAPTSPLDVIDAGPDSLQDAGFPFPTATAFQDTDGPGSAPHPLPSTSNLPSSLATIDTGFRSLLQRLAESSATIKASLDRASADIRDRLHRLGITAQIVRDDFVSPAALHQINTNLEPIARRCDAAQNPLAHGADNQVVLTEDEMTSVRASLDSVKFALANWKDKQVDIDRLIEEVNAVHDFAQRAWNVVQHTIVYYDTECKNMQSSVEIAVNTINDLSSLGTDMHVPTSKEDMSISGADEHRTGEETPLHPMVQHADGPDAIKTGTLAIVHEEERNKTDRDPRVAPVPVAPHRDYPDATVSYPSSASSQSSISTLSYKLLPPISSLLPIISTPDDRSPMSPPPLAPIPAPQSPTLSLASSSRFALRRDTATTVPGAVHDQAGHDIPILSMPSSMSAPVDHSTMSPPLPRAPRPPLLSLPPSPCSTSPGVIATTVQAQAGHALKTREPALPTPKSQASTFGAAADKDSADYFILEHPGPLRTKDDKIIEELVVFGFITDTLGVDAPTSAYPSMLLSPLPLRTTPPPPSPVMLPPRFRRPQELTKDVTPAIATEVGRDIKTRAPASSAPSAPNDAPDSTSVKENIQPSVTGSLPATQSQARRQSLARKEETVDLRLLVASRRVGTASPQRVTTRHEEKIVTPTPGAILPLPSSPAFAHAQDRSTTVPPGDTPIRDTFSPSSGDQGEGRSSDRAARASSFERENDWCDGSSSESHAIPAYSRPIGGPDNQFSDTRDQPSLSDRRQHGRYAFPYLARGDTSDPLRSPFAFSVPGGPSSETALFEGGLSMAGLRGGSPRGEDGDCPSDMDTDFERALNPGTPHIHGKQGFPPPLSPALEGSDGANVAIKPTSDVGDRRSRSISRLPISSNIPSKRALSPDLGTEEHGDGRRLKPRLDSATANDAVSFAPPIPTLALPTMQVQRQEPHAISSACNPIVHPVVDARLPSPPPSPVHQHPQPSSATTSVFTAHVLPTDIAMRNNSDNIPSGSAQPLRSLSIFDRIGPRVSFIPRSPSPVDEPSFHGPRRARSSYREAPYWEPQGKGVSLLSRMS